jgi:hypothetical protein
LHYAEVLLNEWDFYDPIRKRNGDGTKRMPDQVMEKKRQRNEILLALDNELRHNYWEQFIGRKQHGLFDIQQ